MPFDLRLRRDSPIARAELEALMQGAPARRRDAQTWWVSYPDGAPWFALGEAAGEVILSASLSAPRFLRNFANMFDQGLALASAMQSALVEDVGGTVVTPANVDALLRPDGPYVAQQVAAFRHLQAKIDSEALGPLEFPLGAVDLVSEYLVLHVAAKNATIADARRALSAAPELRVRDMQSNALLVEAGDVPHAKILARPDRVFQVWPTHDAPFSTIAPTVLFVAETIAGATGGSVDLCGRGYAPRLRQRAHELARGLGVDFHEWMGSGAPS